jgi:hypothetical protein
MVLRILKNTNGGLKQSIKKNMETVDLWFLASYIAGSISGVWLLSGSIYRTAARITIDTLIENGYIKTRTCEDGEIELIKINDNKE